MIKKLNCLLIILALALSFTFSTATFAAENNLSSASAIKVESGIIQPMYVPCSVYTDGHHCTSYSYVSGTSSYQHDHYINGVKFNCTVTQNVITTVYNCPCGYEYRTTSSSQGLHSVGY